MKLILLIFLTVATISLNAQQSNRAITNKFVTLFNRGNYKEIYALADSSFKADVGKEQLTGLLQGAAANGKIFSNSLLITDSNHVSQYKLSFPKKSLQLTIRSNTSGGYDVFGLTFYKLPEDRSRKFVPNDNPLKTKLDSAVHKGVETFMSNRNVSGLSVGVVKAGQFFYYNYGEIKKGGRQLPTANTGYEIGSITKTFTGVLLARAVLDGKLKLGDDIRKYLPGTYSNLEYQGHPIRIVNLSNHTSRLPSMPTVPSSGADPFSPSVKFTDAMLAEILRSVTLDTIPGTKKEYSNFGFGLLGLILEKVYGKDYSVLVNEFILQPYGMKRSALNQSENIRMAQGYDVEGRPTKNWWNRLAAPAGGVRSTVKDMLLYLQAQLNSGDSSVFLSHQLTFGDLKRGTGLGWGITTTKEDQLRWTHDGGTDGFTSFCLVYPGLNSAIILLTNFGDHSDASFYAIKDPVYMSWLNEILK